MIFYGTSSKEAMLLGENSQSLDISSWANDKKYISKHPIQSPEDQITRGFAPIPSILIKVFMYQLFRSLAYVHSFDICHRNVKLDNLLVDQESGILKLCAFGGVKPKHLAEQGSNISYMYSRNYLAPELILGCKDYTTQIDMWSAGCVLAELLLGKPMFSRKSGIDYLVEITKTCGTPTSKEVREMNPKFSTEERWPQIKPYPWQYVFPAHCAAEAIDLVSRLIVYTPSSRLSPLEACAHPFFNELKDPNARLPSGKVLPALFNFTEYELTIQPALNRFLLPRYMTERENHHKSMQESVGLY